MNILPEIDKISNELKKIFKDLHRHPELGFEEVRTSEIVKKRLQDFGVDEIYTNIGKTGVVAVINGKQKGANQIGLRADMDALPIEETTNLDYASKNPGKMHACGHDGHSTMLLGAAKYLSETKNFYGKVYCVFQPAEEGGNAGAKAMINDGLFKKFKIDSVWGIHNWPGIPVGEAVIHEGFAMAGGDIIVFEVKGKGGHAAQPQYSNDPMVAAGLTITALQSLISRQLDPFKSAVLSITKIEGGSAFNVIPDTVTIGATLRSTDQKNRNMMLEKIKKVAANACAISNCEVNVEIRPGYPPTINNKECAKLASKIFKKTYGENSINLKETPTMGSEDFSYMLEEKPGAYIWLGAGANSEKLHSPYYDFNDELLPIGAQYWTDLAENILVE